MNPCYNSKNCNLLFFFLRGLFHNHQIAMLVCLSPKSKIEEDFFFIPAMKRMCSDFMFRFITIY